MGSTGYSRKFDIKPVGLSDKLEIRMELICKCDCENSEISVSIINPLVKEKDHINLIYIYIYIYIYIIYKFVFIETPSKSCLILLPEKWLKSGFLGWKVLKKNGRYQI